MLVPVLACAQTADYFPLDVGNQWIYRTSGFGSVTTVSMEVTGRRTVAAPERSRKYLPLALMTGRDSAVAASSAKHNGSNLARAPVSQEREVPDAHEAREGHASNRSHVDRAVII